MHYDHVPTPGAHNVHEASSPDALAERLVDPVLELGHIAMLFALQERFTAALSERRETDTDHTVMLGFIAVALTEYDPRLDRGKVALYALVHDVVEVYAGDTSTLHRDKVDYQAKAQAEAASLERLRGELGGAFPKFIELIDTYEELKDLESQFVKLLDKIMPAITNIHNGLVRIIDQFDSAEELLEKSREHVTELAASYGAEHPLIIALHRHIVRQLAQEFAILRKTRGDSA